MKTLIILILLDICMGIISGYINKNLNSRFGIMGIIKHSIVIILNLIFKYLSGLHGIENVYTMFLSFYIIQYSISILENVYYIGVPIPTFLMKRLKAYEEKEGLDKWEK